MGKKFQAQNVEDQAESNMFLTCSSFQAEAEDVWYLDSGCSNHITGRKALFLKINTNVKARLGLVITKVLASKEEGLLPLNLKLVRYFICISLSLFLTLSIIY